MTRIPAFRSVPVAALALLALAPAAAAAQSLSVHGLLDLSVGRTQAPGGTSTNAVDSGKMTTSHIGVRGDEDLGGGLKAVFTVESFLRADTGSAGRFDADAFWGRNAFVGLSSANAGSVAVGRITTPLFVQTLLNNPFGDSFGYSPSIRHVFASGTVTGDSAWNDSVRYVSPRLGGLTLTVHAALGENNGGRNVSATGSWVSGPFNAGLTWQSVEKGATIADSTAWQLAAGYDFGVAKAFGQLTKVDNDTTGASFDILGLGAAVPVGAGKVLAQFGRLKPTTGATRTTVSLGYDQYLSKRTDVYAVGMNDKLSGTGSGNSLSVGMRHRF